MHKTIAAAAALGVFGATAHAQSSVTLYGHDRCACRAGRVKGNAFGRNAARRARMRAGPMQAAGTARPGRRQMLIVTGPASGV